MDEITVLLLALLNFLALLIILYLLSGAGKTVVESVINGNGRPAKRLFPMG